MISITDDTLMIGATEFRSALPKLIPQLNSKKIIIMKRGKPIGIFQAFDKYQQQQEWINKLEDQVLGHLAKERDINSSKENFIPAEEAYKILDLDV
jgi:hypothetical protein